MKYYAAIKKNGHADIVRSKTTPTAENNPRYMFMFGGYRTMRRAVQIAMYQGRIIDTEPGKTLELKG